MKVQTRNKNLVEVIAGNGIMQVIFVPERAVLAQFRLLPNGSASTNAQLISDITKLFENYIKRVYGLD